MCDGQYLGLGNEANERRISGRMMCGQNDRREEGSGETRSGGGMEEVEGWSDGVMGWHVDRWYERVLLWLRQRVAVRGVGIAVVLDW